MSHRITYFFIILLSLSGVVLSAYLLDETRVFSSSFCEIGAYISCSAVIRSKYSTFLGLPVAFYGLVWFAVSGVLAFFSQQKQYLKTFMLYWGIIGIIGIFVLNYIEFFLINAFCLYCSLAHVIAAFIFGLSYLAWRSDS